MLYISNSFSLNMLNRNGIPKVPVAVSTQQVKEIIKIKTSEKSPLISAIGHEDIAKIVSNILNINIPYNRISIKLEDEDNLIVAQYTGPRLPEGTTKLPENAKIEF